MTHHRKPSAGFTLVEMMIIVAIIGLLAAIAVPNFVKARESSTAARFMADLRTAKGAFEMYAIERGLYPPDRTPAIMPPGMEEYLGTFPWNSPTSIGGYWDWDYRQFGCVAGVSVYQTPADTRQLLHIDKTIDDGDLGTGSFRSRSAGYISIIE